jgi:hypothetical protein
MVFGEFIKHMFQFLIEAVLHINNFILCWGMNKHARPTQRGEKLVKTINSYGNGLIGADCNLLCTHDVPT